MPAQRTEVADAMARANVENTVKFLILAIKITVSAAVVWLLLRRVDLAPIGRFLESAAGATAMSICVVVLIAQAGLAALRIRWIMRIMGAELPLKLGFSTWMIGLLISQTLVTFIAGDATRIWKLIRRGYTKRLAGGAIFLERALGLAVMMVLVLLSVPILLHNGATGALRTGILAIGALCAIGIVAFAASAFIHRFIERFLPRVHARPIAAAIADVASAARHLAGSWRLTASVIALSAIMHLANVLCFYLLGKAAGIDLDFVTTAAVALPVMLVALLPIALAGWGVREGAAAAGYSLFGVLPETAIAVSVGFGLALLIAGLPGGFYLWAEKPTEPASDKPEENPKGESLPA